LELEIRSDNHLQGIDRREQQLKLPDLLLVSQKRRKLVSR
jgi:hypothetical protein